MTWGKKKLCKDHVEHEGGVPAKGSLSQALYLQLNCVLYQEENY